MEWTWIRDWWRLKKLRRRQRYSEAQNMDGGYTTDHHNEDDKNKNNIDDDDDADDLCYCDECMNVRVVLISFLLFFILFSLEKKEVKVYSSNSS